MILAQLLLLSQLAVATVASPVISPSEQQALIDQSMSDIMQTQLGRTICHQILNADAKAIEFHLGVSKNAAVQIAQSCGRSEISEWVVPASASVIRKSTPRKYEILYAIDGFPIESWTDSATNIEPANKTVILLRPPTPEETDSHQYKSYFKSRLTELLAHELAVYFDSKSNPAHPDAQYLDDLKNLKIESAAKLSPLIAISNPLTAHTLTYIRALQVERLIIAELIRLRKIDPPADFYDPFIQYLVSEKCGETCLADRVLDMRQVYYPMALPMLAFASYYRAMMQSALPRLQANLTTQQWNRINSAMGVVAADFLTNSSSGERLQDLKKFFFDDASSHPKIDLVTKVMRDDLLPLENPAMFKVNVSSPRTGEQTLLEFMKRPLLSGHNLFQSSGPRVRIRTGNIELLEIL